MMPRRAGVSSTAIIGILAALVIAVPPLLYGPWLPFVDLVAFVGLNSYPPQASGGPFHYYIFQFTYIGHYVASRLLQDLGASTGAQVIILYLVQAGVFFGVIWRLLAHAIGDVRLRGIAIAFGALAYWDGLFLWGGPLAYSLAATLVAAAAGVVYREAAGERSGGGGLIAALCLAAACCHPFALPFSMLLVAVRLVFVPTARIQSAVLVGVLVVFAWVIRRDSPPLESAMLSQLPDLVSFSPANAWARLTGLFTDNTGAVRTLFREVPVALRLYFVVLGLVHLAGFVASPFVAWRARENRALRMLATLNTLIAAAYFTAHEQVEVIPEWPQRILTFWSPLTFVAGIIAPLHLLKRWPGLSSLSSRLPAAAAWGISGGVLTFLVLVQIPILRHGEALGRSYEQVAEKIVRAGISKSFVVVSDMDTVYPFYLRSVPFLLFSDQRMIERGLLFYTEWHFQPRHATRLAETWFDLGRPRYLARFAPRGGLLDVELVAQPPGEFAIPLRTRSGDSGFGQIANQARAQLDQGTFLVNAGANRDALAHYRTALRHTPDDPQLHNRMAITLFSLGQVNDSVEHLRTAVRLKPDYVDARMNLGRLLQHLGDTKAALEQFESVLTTHPDYTPAREAAAKLKSGPVPL